MASAPTALAQACHAWAKAGQLTGLGEALCGGAKSGHVRASLQARSGKWPAPPQVLSDRGLAWRNRDMFHGLKKTGLTAGMCHTTMAELWLEGS